MKNNQNAIYVKCVCGYEVSAFRILAPLGLITPGKNPTEFEVKKIVKSLKCKKCGEKGNISLLTKQSAASNKNPFRATDKSISRIYHRSTCSWMGNVERENEIFFKSKEEAEKRKYRPCQYCHPERLR